MDPECERCSEGSFIKPWSEVCFMLHFKRLCNNYQEGRGGAEKLEGGALHKIAAKIGGAQSKSSHLTEGGP